MKKLILLLFALAIFHFSFSQENKLNGIYPIAFEKNSKVFLQLPEKNKQAEELTDLSKLADKIWNEDVLVYFPEQVSPNLIMEEGWVLFSAIQSPYDTTKWICLERTIMGNDFNLFLFNTDTGLKQLLINNNNSIGTYAFHPVCWSADENSVYLERLEFDTGFEHEGIYTYDLTSGKLTELPVSKKYMTKPLISPDRKYFTYLTTSDQERELIHGVADKLMVYSIESAEEILLSEEFGIMHQALGWYVDEPFQKKKLSPPNNDNLAQLPFKLPWVSGITYCVTRDGSNSPPNPIGSSSGCTNLGPHSYPAATDYDTPNNADHKVLAVAAGTVTTVIYSNSGYGNHIIITHSDNYRTRYAHNKSIAVTVGQHVQQGCYLAIEGTTGNSSGDHIHFEYESPGGGSNIYAKYSECGNCVPHRGYNYTSGNTISPCNAVAPPPNPTIVSSNSCGNKTLKRGNPPSGVTYYWQNTCNGTSTANSALTKTITTSGTYYLRARSNGTWSTCSSKSVTINQIPNNPPAPTTTTTPCGSQTLTRGTPPNGVKFYWQGTSCGTNTGSSAATYSAPATGTYRLRARQTSGGCWSNSCSSVAVAVAPTPPMPPVPSSSSNSCGPITLTRGNPPAGQTYYWQGTSCGISTTNSANTFIVNTSGVYYLRSLSNQGCWSNCRSKSITIIDCPDDLNVSVGPCPAGIVTFDWTHANSSWTIQISLDSAFGSFYSKPASNVTLLTGPAGFTPALTFQANATYYWRILTGSSSYTYGPTFTLPFCDGIPPVTAIAPLPGWQSADFTATFTDTDDSLGSGVGKSFYRVIDFNGTEWRANPLRGFANDNFDDTIINSDWTNHTGTWANASGFLEQSDETLNNTNISASLTQNLSNRYLFHWNAKIDGNTATRRAGFHFFCDSASLTNRGNSYLILFNIDDQTLEFYKVTNNVKTLVKSRNYSFSAGQFYDFKLVYDRINGKMDIYINNSIAESWVDASPIASGNAVSFRTGDASMTINYFKAFRSRAATKIVLVGAGNTNDIRFENSAPALSAGKVESIVTDVAGNLSPLVSVPVDVDWTPPSTIAFINDGSGADISTTYVNNELKANWSPSSDPNSGIAKYHYSIGTSPGDTSLLASTDNFMQMIAINNPLPLVINQLYYYNVRSENGAGLFSSIASSNGQMLVLNTTDIEEENTVTGLNLYPNPFKTSTTLDYTLIKSEKVEVGLFDVLGKEIVSLKNENQGAGKHQITINGDDLELSKGLYLLVFKTEKTSAFIKIVFE